MYSMTRNVLLLLLLLMTGGMFYGFSQGITPDTKALLALLYGLSAGMVVCIVLLIALPVLELARKNGNTQRKDQQHA